MLPGRRPACSIHLPSRGFWSPPDGHSSWHPSAWATLVVWHKHVVLPRDDSRGFVQLQKAFPIPSRFQAPWNQLCHQSTLSHDTTDKRGHVSHHCGCNSFQPNHWVLIRGHQERKHPPTPPYPDSANCHIKLAPDSVPGSTVGWPWCSTHADLLLAKTFTTSTRQRFVEVLH